MVSITQTTFAKGVIAPSLHGRTDLAAYSSSLKEGVNVIIKPHGGADNRPGLRYIHTAKRNICRLIDFQFSKDQTYVIELTDKCARLLVRGGMILDSNGVPIEIVTPYSENDLFSIKFIQSADVLTLVHEKYPPHQLKRYAENDWKLELYNGKNGPFESINIDKNITITTSDVVGTITIEASDDIFTNDMAGTYFYIEQSSFDNTPVWETDKSVTINTERRAGHNYYIARTPGKTGTLRPAHTEGAMFDGYSAGTGVQWEYLHSGYGIVLIDSVISSTKVSATVVSRLPTSVSNASVSIWQNHTTKTITNNIKEYYRYNAAQGDYVLYDTKTSTSTSSVNDSGYVNLPASNVQTYKWAASSWRGANGYPSTAYYYKQRMFFSASTQYPQSVWSTVIGDYLSFDTSNPKEDSDAISYTHADKQLNKIQHLIDVGQLIALTTAGEYKIGSSSEPLTASTFSFSKQGSTGSSEIMPLMVGDTALYVQNKNAIVRSIGYTFETDGYSSSDLTLLANHFFTNHQIVDWTFVNYPYSAAFCVRDDGILLCLTFVKEQEVIAWTEIRTNLGKFKSVTSISEGDEDVLYCAIERYINGEKVTYIERMETRTVKNTEDYFFVDSGLTYDGRNKDENNTITVSKISGWSDGDRVSISFSGVVPSISKDDEIHIPYVENGLNKVMQFTAIDPNNLIFTPERIVPDNMRDTTISNYGLAKSIFRGLDHLNGVSLNILGDAEAVHPVTVNDGEIDIREPHVVVHAGIPIESHIRTLSVNISGGETMLDKKKLITDVSVLVESTRGIYCGETLDNLYEVPQRQYEFYDETIKLASGIVDVKLSSTWNKNGEFYIVQKDPLPMSILSIIPNVTIGGR